MADMLVRNIKPETMAFLKRRAAAKGHTVQDEVRQLLDQQQEEEGFRRAEFARIARGLRERLVATGRDFGDSTLDVRQDRDTDHGRL